MKVAGFGNVANQDAFPKQVLPYTEFIEPTLSFL